MYKKATSNAETVIERMRPANGATYAREIMKSAMIRKVVLETILFLLNESLLLLPYGILYS
jgi:hypothetical protein